MRNIKIIEDRCTVEIDRSKTPVLVLRNAYFFEIFN